MHASTLRALRLFIPVAMIAVMAGCKHPQEPNWGLVGGPDHGCGDLFVYHYSSDLRDVYTVSAERQTLGITTTPTTFDLSVPRNGLTVAVDRYNQASLGTHYCNDVVITGEPQPTTWPVVSGTVTISVDRDSIVQGIGYNATVTLHNVVYVGPRGEHLRLNSDIVMKNIGVGWFPG